MKRFLGADGGAPRKLEKLVDTEPTGDPTTIVSWNINGVVPRSEKNADEVRRFLATCGADCVFLSEVRLKAYCGVPKHKKGDGNARDRRKPQAKEEELDRVRALFDRDAWHAPVYSLSDTKYAGSAVLLKRGGASPKRVWFDLPRVGELDEASPRFGTRHEVDGRIILLEYETLLLLHTYSPNNGVDGPHFAKRAAWEERIRTFARDVKEWGRKPLVYVGDLNVAPRDEDLSHPSWFKRENNVNKRRLGRPPAGGWVTERLDPDDEGQPGCSERECRMFRELLSEGALVDAFRAKNSDVDIDGPNFSYRGAAGDGGRGRYYGKGMRIDHALVSVKLGVAACELLGRGAERVGFMGSDHCPLRLVLGGGGESLVVLGSQSGATIDGRAVEAPVAAPPPPDADEALTSALGEQRAGAILTFANGSRGRVDVRGLDKASRMAVHRWAESRGGFTTASREVQGKGTVLQIKRIKPERAAAPAPPPAPAPTVKAETAPAPAPKKRKKSILDTSSDDEAAPPRAKAPKPTATPAPPPPPPPPPPVREASLHGRLATLRDADAHRSLEKDLRKARDATCFIGRGKAGSSTEKYRVAAGDLGNKARYSPLDRVFVSVNGQTAGRVALLQNGALSAAYRLLEAATAKGVTIVADNLQDRSRGYNLGEQELAHWLTRIARPRYHEVTVGSGVWTPADDAPPPPKRPRPTPPPPPVARAPAPAPEPVDPGAWTCFCTSVNKAEAMECWVCGLRRP